MEDRIVNVTTHEILGPNGGEIVTKQTMDLDKEDERFAWLCLKNPNYKETTQISQKAKCTQLMITKTIGLLIMAGFRPVLGKGNHDEIIFSYETVTENSKPILKTVSVPVRGMTIADGKEFTKLMAQVDNIVGFNVDDQKSEAPLEDRLEQLNDILLKRFEACNDVEDDLSLRKEGNVYSANSLREMASKYDMVAQAYAAQHPEEAQELGTFENSVEHGNTDARILIRRKDPSLVSALKTRDFIARVTQAEMLSKPAVGLYVDTRDQNRNEDTDLRQFVDRRLVYFNELAKEQNRAKTDTKEFPFLDKYSPTYNQDQNREQ